MNINNWQTMVGEVYQFRPLGKDVIIFVFYLSYYLLFYSFVKNYFRPYFLFYSTNALFSLH